MRDEVKIVTAHMLMAHYRMNADWHARAHEWMVRLIANGLHKHAARMQVSCATAYRNMDAARKMIELNGGLS